jgi:nucleoside-diphosphate-sugar epimerase
MSRNKKILITGGSGYVGSLLVNKLAEKGHDITVVDTLWFGNNFKKNKKVKLIKKDIRNIENVSLNGFDTVIHLANIANDPSAQIDPNISWEINVLASYQLLEKAKNSGVKKFIYASSGSVYGVKKEKRVTEHLSLVPISTYNKTKLIFEKILMSYNDKKFKIYCIRPGTVCGVSPRIRWDLSVNLLTLSAIKSNIIKVFGGRQFRPHIHIKDMVRVYEHFLNKNLKTGIYNASFECFTIKQLAKFIQKKTKAKIVYYKSDDIRSYRLNADKLIRSGFVPKFSIKDAINEIIELNSNKKLTVSINNYNLKKMQKLIGLKLIK